MEKQRNETFKKKGAIFYQADWQRWIIHSPGENRNSSLWCSKFTLRKLPWRTVGIDTWRVQQRKKAWLPSNNRILAPLEERFLFERGRVSTVWEVVSGWLTIDHPRWDYVKAGSCVEKFQYHNLSHPFNSAEFHILTKYLLIQGFGRDEELHYNENG